MLRLQGKIAIITGGAQGLGKAIVKRFVEEGAKVITVDRITPAYGIKNMEAYKLDVTDSEACNIFYNYVMSKYGHIDILVNNAGITQDSLTKKMSNDQWNKVIDVNLTGVFYMTRLIGPQMEVLGKGSIINVASIAGEFGNVGQINYSATKAGIIGMTKTWAKEFAQRGANVRTNAISPGFILTDMVKDVPEEILNKLIDKVTLGRLGCPEEIANTALFLASEDASYITGQIIGVNGGLCL